MPKKNTAKSLAPALKSASKQRPLGKRAALEGAVKSGKLPPPPDFKAKTHERWRPMLAEVVALAKAGGLAQLNPTIAYLLARDLVMDYKAMGATPFVMIRVIGKKDNIRRFVKSRR